jgi:hypothetical protein
LLCYRPIDHNEVILEQCGFSEQDINKRNKGASMHKTATCF